MAYKCEECGSSFPKLSQLMQHRRTMNHWKKYQCGSCKKVFNRIDNLERHQKKHESENSHHCPECLKVFISRDALERHHQQHHGQTGGAKKRASDSTHENPEKKRRPNKADEPTDLYNIRKITEKNIEKFKTTATYYKIDVKEVEVRDLPNILKFLKTLFQSIMDKILQEMPSDDLVRLSIDNPELDFPIALPFMKRSALTVDRILSEIERVLQSYEQFVVDETFGIELVHVRNTSGSGYKMKTCVNVTNMLGKKKSIIQMKNTDELCCARAIVTAIAKHEGHSKWHSIRQGRIIQRQLAEELHEQAGVPKLTCGIEEIKQFQMVLPKYQIFVLSKEHFNGIVYSGPDGGVPIYLYNHDGHFDVITTITGFLNRNYFCTKCKKGYQHKERHSCNSPCHFCRQLHEDKDENWQYCSDCNCKFINLDCFGLHRKKTEQGKSTCDRYFRCNMCNQLINRSKQTRDHVCGETYCNTCKEYVDEGHQCFMQKVDDSENYCDKKKKSNDTTYIFFDFECTQDSKIQCDLGYLPGVNNRCVNCKMSWCGATEHRPNMCVAQKVCDLCMYEDVDKSTVCVNCGKNEKVFVGHNTTNSFCQWLFSDENVGATVICHNFKGYDSYPVLNYLHENAILPEVITTGSKYMSITVPCCKLKLIDSINFIPMALAEMPNAFGQIEMAKGYFPHLFNRHENQSVILETLPDKKFYSPDGMKPEKRKEFLSWYKQNQHKAFDFQAELLRYCRSDVDILRKCCLKFRSLFMNLTKKGDQNHGIDPFHKCITIASACNLVFRTLFLEPEMIGIIPPHGYRPEEKQSIIAYKWLSYEAYKQKIHIQTGRTSGEKHIGPYKVDGYYELDGIRHVLEFNGCFWHGCQRCYSKSTINPIREISMGDLYIQTQEKKHYLESQGYTYTSMWECDFKRQMGENESMRQFIESLNMVTPLEPREAFYGGRTEAFKLYIEASETESIKYYDVTSLYPFINKTGKIPLGHPEIITENFKEISCYEGLIKCKVLPPRSLYVPVLPMKSNGKLIFSLCRTCSENYQHTPCHHGSQQRSFIGTWVTDELKMALQQGYRVQQIYEVWHFDNVSQYDHSTKSGGVFTEYVNTFLKIKQEASGWPDWCVDEKTKRMYIDQYSDREGILLDYHRIKENPGLRSLAKLMLNSFWGKFGQRTNLTQTTYTDDPVQFMDMMTSDLQEVKNVRFINDQAVQIDWVYDNDFVGTSSKTNVVIAAYTTAQARLKLYSYLQRLKERTIYCDTDSVVFTSCSGDWEPPLGDYLGDLTDEVSDRKATENKITHFVTGGPKNYAYKLARPNKKGQTSICKVRGITLNFKNALEINFDSVKKMVKNRKSEPITVVDTNKIMRNPDKCCIITKTETKDYKIVFDKRVIIDHYQTVPYGM